MRLSTTLVLSISMLVGACGALPPLNPSASENRSTRTASDATKIVTVREGMVWYDARPASKGIRFPPGTYALEAEDDQYWYFRAPKELEIKAFRDGNVIDDKNVSGGIMLRKHVVSLVPAAAYVEGEASIKTMVWKLGSEFMHQQGKDWTRSY